MRIMFWDTDEPKDRITLSVISLIALTLLARTIVVSSSAAKNLDVGAVHPIAMRWRTYFLTDVSLYSVYLIMALACVAIGVIAINAVIISVRWFRRHNAR